MTRKLLISQKEAQGYLRVAISERAIVEVDVGGMTFRFLPSEYVDLDRKIVPEPVRDLP